MSNMIQHYRRTYHWYLLSVYPVLGTFVPEAGAHIIPIVQIGNRFREV